MTDMTNSTQVTLEINTDPPPMDLPSGGLPVGGLPADGSGTTQLRGEMSISELVDKVQKATTNLELAPEP